MTVAGFGWGNWIESVILGSIGIDLCIPTYVLLMYCLCIADVLIRPYMPPHVPWRRLESTPAIVINFTKSRGREHVSMIVWEHDSMTVWQRDSMSLGGYRMPIPVGVPRVVKGDQKGHVVCGSSWRLPMGYRIHPTRGRTGSVVFRNTHRL
jgi:hypothetical protein